MTHSDLVQLGARWLARQGCAVVVTEMASAGGEEPDAIGWKGISTTMIECKATRQDFLSEVRHLVTDRRMGDYRYYLVPTGLIHLAECPAGWGLLCADPGGRVRIEVQGGPRAEAKNREGETAILLSCLRRIGQSAPVGVSVKYYKITSRNRATLGVDTEAEGGTE